MRAWAQLLIVAAMLTVTVTPVFAQDALFVRPGSEPLAGQPFELFFAGTWIYYFDSTAPEPEVQIDGNVIDVHVDALVPPILPPPTDYAFGVPIGGLPADVIPEQEYEVRLFVADSTIPWATYPLTVRRPTLEVEPLDGPRLESASARILVRGIGRCPEANEPIVEDRVIYLPQQLGCVADPPQPFTSLFTTPPLEAGDYEIYAVHADSAAEYTPEDAIGYSSLTVDPQPTLWDGRFQVAVQWQDFAGATGPGRPVAPPSEQSALFWFFGPKNWELMVKVLDGCSINDHYWVLAAASTNVAYALSIVDQESGLEWTFDNPLGVRSPAEADILAFPCDPGPADSEQEESHAG